MATVTNVRMVAAPEDWYPGLALAFDWQGRTRMTQTELKYAVLNAGWVSILDDDVPSVQVSTRHRDGTPCSFSGSRTLPISRSPRWRSFFRRLARAPSASQRRQQAGSIPRRADAPLQ